MEAMLGQGSTGLGGVCRQLNRCRIVAEMGKSNNPFGNMQVGKMPSGLNPFGGGGSLPGLGGFSGRKK